MILLALTAYVALFIATSVVAIIVSVIVNKLPRANSDTTSARLGSERGPAFGKFLFDPTAADGVSLADVGANLSNLLARILGLMQPYGGITLPNGKSAADSAQYFIHALEGALSLIGVDSRELDPSTIVKVVFNFALTPGYYLTLIREIARDMALFADFSGGGGGTGVFGILEKIRTLKIIRFVDTCARLGIVASQATLLNKSITPGVAVGVGEPPVGGDAASDLETINNPYDVARKRVSRSRETSGSKRLAWSHSSLGYTRSELVTPDLVRALGREKIIGAENGLSSLRHLKARKIASEFGRITPADRKYHEDLLDAEYMPFYFHDLRTNEILSFHAFLSSLTDGYTANYTSTDGFGRMDPVQTYKNTTRAVSFTFNVVATSEKDHAQMWYSINKLVNMVYPQWSEGDTITGEGGETFTQPFSQTIAASPMLRVRIGDVIHSNYSRFGLGRIFGLDKEGAKLKSEGVEKAQVIADDYKKIFDSTLLAKTPTKSYSVGVKHDEDDLNFLPKSIVGNDPISVTNATLGAMLVEQKVTLSAGEYRSSETIDKINAFSANSIAYSGNTSGVIVSSVPDPDSTSPFAWFIVKLDNERLDLNSNLRYKFVSVSSQNVNVVIADKGTISFDDIMSNYENAAITFMKKENNAVVKSFEDGAGGRGLAGFITSLGLEYGSTDTTWTTEVVGARAPNMVTIVVSFTPIHDIPMGLAADGTARAAAYPVGDVTRKRFYQDLLRNEDDIRK